MVDARDGASYNSDVSYAYDAGVWYTIAVSADIATETYDVEIGRCGETPETLIVDPFIGAVLGTSDCQRRLEAASGPGEILRPAVHLKAARPREILVRLLSNLKQVFLARPDLERAVACIDRILIAMPDAHHELRDRGLVFEQLGYFAAAASDLERYLEVAPNDDSAPAIAQRLKAVRMRVRLH